MNNRFKIKQISTDQYVLTRQEGAYTEYINYELDVIKLDAVGSNNNVVYDSICAAQGVLQTFNSKQLLNEMRQNRVPGKSGDYIIDNDVKGLSIKSVKFKYKVDKDGSEELIGVNNNG